MRCAVNGASGRDSPGATRRCRWRCGRRCRRGPARRTGRGAAASACRRPSRRHACPHRRRSGSGLALSNSADHHRHAVIAHDQLQLLEQIGFEQVRPGYGRRKISGRRHMAIGLARVDLRIGIGLNADLRIEGAIARVVVGAFGQSGEGVAQESGVARIEGLQRLDGFLGVGKVATLIGFGAGDRILWLPG